MQKIPCNVFNVTFRNRFMSRATTNHFSVDLSGIKGLDSDSMFYISFCLMDDDVFVTVISSTFTLGFS